MHFALTPEQELARNALRELLSEHCSATHLRKVFEAAEPARVPGLWAKLHELGVIGALAPEALGGVGLNAIDLAVLLEETGRAAVPEPVVETAFVAVPLLAALPDNPRAAQLLRKVLDGQLSVSVALGECTSVPAAGHAGLILSERSGELHALTPSAHPHAVPRGAGGDGTTARAHHGARPHDRASTAETATAPGHASADSAARAHDRASAAESGPAHDRASQDSAARAHHGAAAVGGPDGGQLGGVNGASTGGMTAAESGNPIQLSLLESVDRARPVYRLEFQASDATCLARGETAQQLVAAAQDHAALGTAAQLVGLGWRMLELTIAHVKTRKQFGQPVGAFQAVKHQLVDARLALEFAAPLVYRAAHSIAQLDPARSLHVSMAKAYASEAALLTARKALQLHGAIGYSYEYELHMYMKRAWALAAAYGDAREHRKRIADVLLTAQGESHA